MNHLDRNIAEEGVRVIISLGERNLRAAQVWQHTPFSPAKRGQDYHDATLELALVRLDLAFASQGPWWALPDEGSPVGTSWADELILAGFQLELTSDFRGGVMVAIEESDRKYSADADGVTYALANLYAQNAEEILELLRQRRGEGVAA